MALTPHNSTGAVRPRTSLVSAASRIDALAAPKPMRLPFAGTAHFDPYRSSSVCRFHSELTDCTAQFVGMLPTFAVEETVVPNISVPVKNQIDVLPPVSRQRMSLVPLPS